MNQGDIRPFPYASQVDGVIELLEKIYSEEMKIKSRIKILEQTIHFSKLQKSTSPIPDADYSCAESARIDGLGKRRVHCNIIINM